MLRKALLAVSAAVLVLTGTGCIAADLWQSLLSLLGLSSS